MNIVETLNGIYYEFEWWHNNKISNEEITSYHNKLLSSGNILVETNDSRMLGYVEFWRINYEQFGRIICGEHFSAYHEDIISGHIAYVANTFIYPKFRSTGVVKSLRNKFFLSNFHCQYFVGEARRKKTAPLKVFKRDRIISYLKLSEELDGKRKNDSTITNDSILSAGSL